MSYIGWLALIIAIVMIIDLILPWITYPVAFNPTGKTAMAQATGFDGISKIAYQPILVLIGIILLFATVLIEFTRNCQTTIVKVVPILAGALMIIGSASILFDIGSFAANFAIPCGTVAKVGFGSYIAIVAGAAVLIAAILRMLNILKDPE
jgi:hypothetical protein